MLYRSFNRCTLNELRLQVDQFWVLFISIVIWLLTEQNFSASFPNQTSTAYRISAATAVLGIFGSLNLREIVRAKVAHHWIAQARRNAFLRHEDHDALNDTSPSAATEIRAALVGPITSLSLAVLLAAGYVLIKRLIPNASALQLLVYLSVINHALALTVLLPAFPFDGGYLLRFLLWQAGGDLGSATKTTETVGRFLVGILFVTGLGTLLWGSFAAGTGQILLGCFLAATARARHHRRSPRTAPADQTVAQAMTPNPVTVSPEMTLSHIVNQVVLRHGVSFLPVVENGILLGKIDRNLLASIDREYWGSTKAEDIFVALRGDTLLSTTTPVSAVLDLIARTGQRKFLVVQGQSLAGVLTLADLTKFMVPA